MWISRKLADRPKEDTGAETGKVTIASPSAAETGGTVNSRSVTAYAPYGYICTVPAGEEVLLLPQAEGQAAVGVRPKQRSGEAGEILLVSKGGASLRLGNDGCIYLNGRLFMNAAGEVVYDI